MTPVAAVDLGTNSTRLLIAGEREVRRTVVTGLGRGLTDTGRLSADGWAATLRTLQGYRVLMEGAGVERARAVMTAVGRQASDTGEFLVEAESTLGIRPEVISGDEEARLSYRGAVADLDGEGWTVVDIGGGSTEIVGAGGGDSYDVGSVVTTDRYLSERPASSDDVTAARTWVSSMLRGHPPASAGVVGVAGTWTSLAGITLGREPYDPNLVHHSTLDRVALERWVECLGAMSFEDTARLAGLDPARAPVILGGAVVAEAVASVLDVDNVVVSEHDLLDGIVSEL
ncbi:MAG TPA: exopolyphosphatase [Acidimicrobiia bacterium]|nr:exopolyphosphatase [Acidimicrobiia bacterium]